MKQLQASVPGPERLSQVRYEDLAPEVRKRLEGMGISAVSADASEGSTASPCCSSRAS